MEIEPDALRLPPTLAAEILAKTTAAKKQVPRHRSGEFLKGPIPLAWLSPAARLPGRALAVALSIWFERCRKRRNTVKLTSPLLARFGVNRKALYRGLQALESAGLVTVERQQGKNPVVTIRTPPVREGEGHATQGTT
jgi:hypothetical protein